MENKNNKSFNKTKAYTKEEIDAILEEVDSKLSDFIQSGKYKDVLLMMGNLGRYSFINQMYILLQNGNATTVNGMQKWNWYGRSVKPGEKALRIFSPIKKKEYKPVVDEDGNPKLTAEGKEVKQAVMVIKGYRPSFVFDISQTQGKELDVYKFNESITVDDKETILKGLANVVGKNDFMIRYAPEEELGKGCYGLCNHQSKEILLLEGMSDLQTVSTAVHECGHALAHSAYRKDFEGLTPMEKREIKEVEAESIACVVCQGLGLDTENFNFSYITGWSDGDISKFRKNMDVIGYHANQLLNGIEEEFTSLKIAENKAKKEAKENPLIEQVEETPRNKKDLVMA